MWYSDGGNELRYDKPIFAGSLVSGELPMLLLPQIRVDSYEIVGYNWFNLAEGEWNSCACFKTPQAAVMAYSCRTIFNGFISIGEV